MGKAGIKMEVNPKYHPFLSWAGRYGVLMGGAGSGKSYAVAQKLLLRMTTEAGLRVLVVRKVGRTIRQSCFRLMVDLIRQYDLEREFQIRETDMSLWHLSGNEMIFAGVDDVEKLKSIVGITTVWCEEATELDEADFSQLELRVRGETKSYKQFVLTFNPISEEHWLKARFFDKSDKDVLRIVSTYRDNFFLDKEYVKHLEERVSHDDGLYRVYVLGEWGRPRTGGEFYRNFRASEHVGDHPYDPELALHLAFDFNSRPYNTCVAFQIHNKCLTAVDEVCLPWPHNSDEALSLEVARRFGAHANSCFVYGDASGRAKQTLAEAGVDHYSAIRKNLAFLRPQFRVPPSNPNVLRRGDFANAVLAGHGEVTVRIDRRCKNLIGDFLYGKQDSDGKKLKEKGKDDIGQFEKYHHASDAFDYCLTQAFATQFAQFSRGPGSGHITVGTRKPIGNAAYGSGPPRGHKKPHSRHSY